MRLCDAVDVKPSNTPIVQRDVYHRLVELDRPLDDRSAIVAQPSDGKRERRDKSIRSITYRAFEPSVKLPP